MPTYLLSIFQPDGGAPDPDRLAEIGEALGRVNADLRASGSWVFTGGLHPASSATVVRPAGAITDGPYLESKEYIGGVYVIDVEDLDVALDWAGRVAEATTLPIEVRPFQGRPPF